LDFVEKEMRVPEINRAVAHSFEPGDVDSLSRRVAMFLASSIEAARPRVRLAPFGFAVAAVCMVAGLSTGSAALAFDSDWADCARAEPDISIIGCTAFIARAAEETRENQAEAYNNRGSAYDQKGAYDRAIADYDQAIALQPHDADLYYNRGSAYDDKGEYDRAIADYDKAIELNPDYAATLGKRVAELKQKLAASATTSSRGG
jgi:tetratricopeptide (TPR) repeat protein